MNSLALGQGGAGGKRYLGQDRFAAGHGQDAQFDVGRVGQALPFEPAQLLSGQVP